ncbi:O-methylsterigmatocystin oxidoreductase [Leucoagaricus sp. SymC.cos]|nr:O-methylsterigmatocystin oxidoreductase [Leucoagaricus sp. SymC.cos]
MSILGLREAVVLLASISALLYRFRGREGPPLPPGPPRWPLVGNALSIPTEYTHKFYKRLGDELGTKILYLEAFGQPIVVLNSVQMGKDLLEKRSSIYSDRPHMTMLLDIMKIDYFFSFLPYGDIWRQDRRLLTQYFSPKTLNRDKDRIVEFVRRGLLAGLYQSSQDFRDHVRSCIGGFFISVSYGLHIHRFKDPIMQLSEDAFNAVTRAVAPGRFLADAFPTLRHVPAWMPGAGFKTLAKKWRKVVVRMSEDSYAAMLKTIDNGSARTSFLSENIARQSENPTEAVPINDMKRVAQQVYGAGYETTSVTLTTFILAMLIHPDVQKRVQAELDSVIANNRLPEFSDEPRLPYLCATIKEVFRWNPIVPLGVPRSTTEDDVYEGYYIPKGSTVLFNAYAMLYDEEVFPDPETFKPERFLKDGKLAKDVLDPEESVTFGFGRRTCPGAYLVHPILFLATASLLTLFEIVPELDEQGSPIEVVPQFTSSLLVS